MADTHASLAVDETLWSRQPANVEPFPAKQSRGFWNSIPWSVAALLVALAVMIFWPKQDDGTFVTMAETHAAFWESGNLPTADGSRLGKGTLRLAEGMATLKFDSGAEVILEAPATLTLFDSMNTAKWSPHCRTIPNTTFLTKSISSIGTAFPKRCVVAP